MPDTLRLSADRDDMDRELIHHWIGDLSYWATGRPRSVQDAAIDASRNYGAFDSASGTQLGYARVVTDAVTFAWLCDVFVDESARGRGVGVALIEYVVADLEPLGLKRIALATGDTHGLYERFGFEPLANPENWMARAGTPAGS